MGNDVEKKKICFVVTPIGGGNTDIRRHIDGIVDQAIIPAIGSEFEVEVAHRKYEIGSINNRIISSIYNAELVIANLTSLNPNVMFELAIRYSFGKPAIVIAEQGTKLPFDIIDENTIFYVNDPAGAADLKEALIKFTANIDYSSEKYGPVFSALEKASVYKQVESEDGALPSNELQKYIIDKLDDIENKVYGISTENNRKHLYREIQNDIAAQQAMMLNLDKMQLDIRDIDKELYKQMQREKRNG